MFRQDNTRLKITVDGVDCGIWYTKTGGDTDSATVQIQQGSMGGQISLGGPPQGANLVLTRLEDAQILAQRKWLRSRAGKGSAQFVEQILDDEGNPFDDPETYNGVLKRVKPSDRSNQGGTAAMFEIEIEVNGLPA